MIVRGHWAHLVGLKILVPPHQIVMGKCLMRWRGHWAHLVGLKILVPLHQIVMENV